MPSRVRSTLRLTVRASLLALSLVLTGLALIPADALAASCQTPGTTRWVYAGCCGSLTRYNQEKCTSYYVWSYQGVYKCENRCMF
jgi:hypothetical protein